MKAYTIEVYEAVGKFRPWRLKAPKVLSPQPYTLKPSAMQGLQLPFAVLLGWLPSRACAPIRYGTLKDFGTRVHFASMGVLGSEGFV